jgi:hypothetical protein
LFFEGKFPMAHSLAHSNEAMAGQRSPGGNQPSLDSQIVWQARIDLAACFRMAMREGDPKSARLHLESAKRQLDREEPEFRH